ncbi:MAG: hypothetical protein D6681_00865 [Calditrichaeota bacterium]|nr:MAG: hypothetical protein D6681_00865 [Calditrichota bacterium]
MKRFRGYPVLLLVGMWLAGFPLLSQTIFHDYGRESAISVEIIRPEWSGEDNANLITSAIFFTAHAPLGETLFFVGELPVAHAGFSSDFGEGISSTNVGNPYVGLEYRPTDNLTFWEMGIRLPLASEESEATFVGFFSDPTEREEAFTPDFLTISGMANVVSKDTLGAMFRVRLGPSLAINTDKGEFEDATELFLIYSAMAGYRGEAVRAGIAFIGRWWTTGEGEDFGENSLHQLGLFANVGSGSVRPGLSVRIPLDKDFRDTLDFMLGLNVDFHLR